MQDKKENKNSTLENHNDFSDSTKNNQEEHQNNKLDEKEIEAENQSLEIDENDNNIDEIEKLSAEIEKLKEEKLRLLAEMENLRKRSEKEKLDSIKYGSINFARDILSPGDNLTRALEAVPKDEKASEKFKNLIDGLNMVQKEFSTILGKHGINKIDAINTKFDHNLHQAMVELEDDKVDEGTVVQEMQSGYTMYDRLLRPSMVAVSKKPAKKDNSKKND
ncbi:nucleotide exchange factor GrpE [Alphaproteobacteria bacterium]|nr:nucleotide exchange factor GrpE [Alphaproteobacteria bacterium]